jgi:hypothetical protein
MDYEQRENEIGIGAVFVGLGLQKYLDGKI